MTFLKTHQIFLQKHHSKRMGRKNFLVHKNIYKKIAWMGAEKQQQFYQHPLQAQCLLEEKCLFY